MKRYSQASALADASAEFESRLSGKINRRPSGHLFIFGGEGEIRTRGAIADTTVFKTVPLNHSGTSPGWNVKFQLAILYTIHPYIDY